MGVLFSPWLPITVWWHFVSAWKTPFSISHRVGLLGANFLSICLSGNVLIYPSFLKPAEFCQVWTPWWTVFSFSTLKMLFLSLLAPMVSNNTTSVNFIEDHFYIISQLSFATFKIHSLSLAFNNLIITCLCVDVFKFVLLGIHWIS